MGTLVRRDVLGGLLAMPAIIRPGLLMPVSARWAGSVATTHASAWAVGQCEVDRLTVDRLTGNVLLRVRHLASGERRMILFADKIRPDAPDSIIAEHCASAARDFMTAAYAFAATGRA